MIQEDNIQLAGRLRRYFETIEPETTIDVLPLDAADTSASAATATPSDPETIATPLLVCTAQSFQPAPGIAGLDFVVLSTESTVAEVQEGLDANALGFDPAAPATTPDEAEAFRAQLVTSRAFTARLDQQPVAGGMFTTPVDGIAELVGITTLEAYRSRGIAAALTSEIVRTAFAHGVDTAFLRTDNMVAERVYRRLGFVPVATLISRRGDESST